MFKLYDVVKLKNSRPDIGIKENNMGSIIDIIGNGKAYTVEFFDENNETIEESIYEYFEEDDLISVELQNDFQPVNIKVASGK